MSTSTPQPEADAPERAPLVDLNEALRAAPQRKGRFGAPEAAAVLLVGALIVVTVAEAEQSPYDEALLALAEAPFEPSAAPTDARSAKVRHLYRLMLRHEVEPDGLSLLTGERSAQEARVRAMLVELARADRDGPDAPVAAPALVAEADAPSVRRLPGALPSAADTVAKARDRAAQETGAAPADDERYQPVTGVVAEPLATRESDDVAQPLTDAERAAMADLTVEALHRTSGDAAEGDADDPGHTHAHERAEALQAKAAPEDEGEPDDAPLEVADAAAAGADDAKVDDAKADDAKADDAKADDAKADAAAAVAVPDMPFAVVPADALPEELRGKLHVPLLKGSVLQAFGEAPSEGSRTNVRHTGWTIRAPKGHRIRCAADGKVVFSGIYKGYGRMVIVDHGDGLHTIYANLKSFLAIKGMEIKRGQPIGTIGQHAGGLPIGQLYFELRQNGSPIDPEGWFADPTKEEGY